jgi:hypothetical protein
MSGLSAGLPIRLRPAFLAVLLFVVGANPAHAQTDEPPVPSTISRGDVATGDLNVNGLRGGVQAFQTTADGYDVTLAVSFAGTDPQSPTTFVTVYGPSGLVGQATPTNGEVRMGFQTVEGQTYKVILAIYQPTALASYRISMS